MVEKEESTVSETILVHYDVSDNRIPFEVFKQAALSIEKIANEFNKKAFDGKFTTRIYVLPPKPGSFSQILQFINEHPAEIGMTGWLCNLLTTRYLKKSLAGIGAKLGNGVLEKIENKCKTIASDMQQKKIDAKVAIVLLVEMVKRFLSEHGKELKDYDITPQELPEAYAARNDFYAKCSQSNNIEIKGIGFTSKDDFPIKRKDFISYIEQIKEPDNVVRKLHKVVIAAPVVLEEDKGEWRTKILPENKPLSFKMTDENFRDGVLLGRFPIKQSKKDDEMVVLVEYRERKKENGKIEKTRSAVKVYSYNQTIIEEIPDDLHFDIPLKPASNQLELL